MGKRLVILFLSTATLLVVNVRFNVKIRTRHSLHNKKESGTETTFITDAMVCNHSRLESTLKQSAFNGELTGATIKSHTQSALSSSKSEQLLLTKNIVNSSSPIFVLGCGQQIKTILNSRCSDSLCTQYLSSMDLTKFKLCTRHLNKHEYDRSVANGTCRFINGTSHHKVGLYSFPGSGNTWVRGLLEKATGICTGSVYCDASLRVAGFNGEGVTSSAVLAVKTHQSIKSFQGVIHIVRCPRDAIVSEWNRKHGSSSSSGGRHTALASQQAFGENKEWDTFVHEWSRRWRNGVFTMAKYQQKQVPLLRVFYEDLISNATHEVIRMLNYLNVPYVLTDLELRLNSGYQKFHRQKEQTLTPFTQQQIAILREIMSDLIDELSSKGYHDSEAYVQNYLSTCAKCAFQAATPV